jgi:hypothetical protein
MDCYLHAVGEAYLELVVCLALQVDAEPRMRLAKELLEQLVLLVKLVKLVNLVLHHRRKSYRLLALERMEPVRLIQRQFLVDCECSHRVERLQHQSRLELVQLS